MKRHLFSCLCLFLAALVVPARAEEIPELLSIEGSEPPVFVAADRLIDDEGRLDVSLLHRATARVLVDYLPSVPGRVELTEFYDLAPPPGDMSTFSRALHVAELVLRGEVVGKEPGFSGASPGTLYLVRPLETLRGKVGQTTPYFFFVPVGEIAAGGYEIVKTDSRYPTPPEIGDEVLLMIPWRPAAEDRFLQLPDNHGLVVLYQKGSVGWMAGHVPGQGSSYAVRGAVERPEQGEDLHAVVLRRARRTLGTAPPLRP